MVASKKAPKNAMTDTSNVTWKRVQPIEELSVSYSVHETGKQVNTQK